MATATYKSVVEIIPQQYEKTRKIYARIQGYSHLRPFLEVRCDCITDSEMAKLREMGYRFQRTISYPDFGPVSGNYLTYMVTAGEFPDYLPIPTTTEATSKTGAP